MIEQSKERKRKKEREIGEYGHILDLRGAKWAFLIVGGHFKLRGAPLIGGTFVSCCTQCFVCTKKLRKSISFGMQI